MAEKATQSIHFGKLTGKETDTEIIRDILNKRAWYFEETRVTRRQWLINAAFARSQQWTVLHRTEDRLIFLSEPPGRKQVTVDMIRPWKTHMIANLTLAMPMFQAQPNSLDGAAVSAARVGSGLLQHYWENWIFELDYITLMGYLIDFANAFVYLNYVEGGDYVDNPLVDFMTGEPILDDDGKQRVEHSAVGDITRRVLPPHYVAMPTDDDSLDEKPWVILHPRKPLDYFKETYGKKGKEVVPESQSEFDFYGLYRINDNSGGSQGQPNAVEYADEIIYMQKPSDTNPDGMVAIVAGGILLKKDVWPYKRLQTYPLVHIHYPKDSGEMLARSPIEPQIPIQKAINLLYSVFMENAEDMAHIKWLISNQADVSEITDDNAVIRYNAGYKPEQSDVKPLPQYVMDLIGAFKVAMRDVQSYHGSSMGMAEGSVRSDVHAQNLQDQDLLPLQVVDNIVRIGFENMGSKILQIAAEKLDTDRIITYTGTDHRQVIEHFRGDMLGDVSRVKVRLTNTHLRSKAAVTNNILQMVQLGLITNQYGMPDMTRALRMLEFAVPDSEFDSLRVHSDLAYAENDKMMEGRQQIVLPWQNHPIHMQIHQDFMNSPEFMKLIEIVQTDKEAQGIVKIFIQHLQETEKLFKQSLQSIKPTENKPEQKPANKPPQAKKRAGQ